MRKRWKVTLWTALAAAVVLAATAGIVVYAFFAKFYPTVPAPDYSKPANLAETQRQDLDYFKNEFIYDRAFTPAARAHAEALRQQYLKRTGKMSPAEFDLAINRMVALADNGHSNVSKGPLSRLNDRIPCRLYRFSDGYYVMRAELACQALLGARVTEIDGRPIEQVADAMFKYAGGPKNHYDQFIAPFYLESPALLAAAGYARNPGRLTLHFVSANGGTGDADLLADPPNPDAPRVYSDQYLSPQAIPGEKPGWKAYLPEKAEVPLFIQDYADPFQSRYWPASKVYYAEFRSNEDEDGYPIGPFVSKVHDEIVADKPRAIVLDLRLDQGGNYTKTASLMENLATLSPSIKHVYILTGAWTFSAGIVSAALAKYHGGGKVTVLGEPVGDRLKFWAEGGDFTLPNSGIDINFATGLHDYRHPCAGETGCFWILHFYPVYLKTLDPDIRIPYSFADYQTRHDPVLDKALELASALK